MAQSPVPLGPIATRVLYEDERIRIWDQVIEPGRSIGPHRHDLRYALITVDGGDLEVAPVPGYPAVHGEETIRVEMQSETVDLLPEGAVEDALNVGDRTYRAILVEFKKS